MSCLFRGPFLARLYTAIVMLVMPVIASAVSIGTYTLGNHPDAGETPPPYGMRLDGLLGYGVYTFDFEHASSNMQLTYNGSTIHISGTAFGGSDNGAGYDVGSTALWAIDFLYDTGVTQPGGEGGVDDVVVDLTGHHANSGTVTSVLGNFDLRSHADSSSTFNLGDETGAPGYHRNFPGISGWGWLDFSLAGQNDWKGQDVGDTADFIFTAVPVPAAVWLFGSGLIALGGLARRR